MSATLFEQGRRRVVIEALRPQVEGGRFAIKRAPGEAVAVEADVFADGHDVVACALLYRAEGEAEWHRVPMHACGNDRWRGEFAGTQPGRYRYTVCGWIDAWGGWRRDLEKRRLAGQDLAVAFQIGARLVEEAVARVRGEEREAVRRLAAAIALRGGGEEQKLAVAHDEALADLIAQHPDPELVTRCELELPLDVDSERARFSAWYEMFPRSAASGGRHGTFRDCAARLPLISHMGFDVLYLPPIHPVGITKRKGRNNAQTATPEDVGSPWAIGGAEGGHKAVHPQLGSLEDFRALVAQARAHGLAVALDIAFQCSPDHPYVREHPQWFRHRPDGSIQFAENPPKKYEDIYPFDFETTDWQALWQELKSVFLFWIGQGVRIFRVDNPHTKSFRFWEWAIAEIRRDHPDIVFLSEAFTRPKVMHHLAKIGFSQSYTYFTWRNTKRELIDYFTELSQGEGREYLRPNVWPNTPDILNEYLQFGGRPAFVIRLVLAATLAASYGIYGPAFELCESRPREPGSEEYLNSEKYEIRDWDLTRSDSLKDLIARVNRIRRENPALHDDWSLRFHAIDNEQMIAYSKRSADGANAVLVVVNLDPYHTQAGWLELSSAEFDLDPAQPCQMHDLLSGARYLWHGGRNYVRLDPHTAPAHVFRLRRHVRSERDFDYFL